MTAFNALIAQWQPTPAPWIAQIDDSWAQGRSLFGGIQAAVAVAGMRALLPNADTPLRVLQVAFLAPVPPGAVTVDCRLLRAGKNVTQIEARLLVDGQAAALMVGIFGAARASRVRYAVTPNQAEPKPASALKPAPYMAGFMPAFLQHFDQRWAEGNAPFSGQASRQTRIHIALRAPSDDALLNLVTIADMIPTPALCEMPGPTMASSLTWTLELLEPPVAEEGHYRMDTRITAAGEGYVSQHATLHAPDGRVVALYQQSVVVFG